AAVPRRLGGELVRDPGGGDRPVAVRDERQWRPGGVVDRRRLVEVRRRRARGPRERGHDDENHDSGHGWTLPYARARGQSAIRPRHAWTLPYARARGQSAIRPRHRRPL